MKYRRNIGENFCHLRLSSDFLDITPKAPSIKNHIDKMHFIKTEKLCSSKDTVKKIIRQLANYEKIFANHISIKGLHSQSWMISKQANSKNWQNI